MAAWKRRPPTSPLLAPAIRRPTPRTGSRSSSWTPPWVWWSCSAGLVVVLLWNVWIGAGLGALGAAYVYAVYRRYQQWKGTREAAGLPT
jgi:hypothetical protein